MGNWSYDEKKPSPPPPPKDNRNFWDKAYDNFFHGGVSEKERERRRDIRRQDREG